MDDKPLVKNRVTSLFYLVLVLGLAGVTFTLLRRNYLYDSAALYVGLPLLLAIGLSLTPKTKSALGATMKGITVALLLSAIVFQEGTICIIFAAPIFYGVGALLAWTVDSAHRRKDKNSKILSISAFAIFAVLALEGSTTSTSFDRDSEVAVSKVINASRAEILAQLSKPINFGPNKPMFLSLFPYPVSVGPLGLGLGNVETISFTVYKHIWWTKREGTLTMKVVESTPDKIVFLAINDNSYLSHYLKWQRSEINLDVIDESHTRVSWRLAYRRSLDPAWYFAPLQYYAVKLAAEELIDHVATPHG